MVYPIGVVLASIFIQPKMSDGRWDYRFGAGLASVWTFLCACWQVPIFFKRYYLQSWINIAGDNAAGGSGNQEQVLQASEASTTNKYAEGLFWENLSFYQARMVSFLYSATFLAGVRTILFT